VNTHSILFANVDGVHSVLPRITVHQDSHRISSAEGNPYPHSMTTPTCFNRSCHITRDQQLSGARNPLFLIALAPSRLAITRGAAGKGHRTFEQLAQGGLAEPE